MYAACRDTCDIVDKKHEGFAFIDKVKIIPYEAPLGRFISTEATPRPKINAPQMISTIKFKLVLKRQASAALSNYYFGICQADS